MQARGVKNDDASSIKIKSGYTVTLYSSDNFTGASMVLSGNDGCFIDNNFNDMVSSMKINTNGVILYQNCAYGGYSGAFDSGNYTLNDLSTRGISNDDVSSLKVINGYAVTLYELDNFSGASVTLTSDNSCLSSLSWNDRISSITVASSALLTAEVAEINNETKSSLNSYPNPAADGKVNIRYVVRAPGHVKITVHTLSGIELSPLINEYKNPGTFHITWDTSNTPKGLYVVKMLSEGHTLKTTKVILKQ